ncbi:MAG TPA: glycine--tRNA ligase [Phaeodactylibacter sp.]|nr:glycine--tRNA ligase [Phaeodactylibacter sp.]
MANKDNQFQKLVSHCKEYGFIFQSSEVYDGLAAVYDYGPYGVELKNNIKDYWWKSMVQMHENIVGIDAAIFMHPKVWKASGHVDAFNDPMIDNKVSKKRYRADQLVEEYVENKVLKKANKEIEKARKRFGDVFDEEQYKTTNPRVMGYLEKAQKILTRLNTSLTNEDLADVKALIEELEIACPESGSREWTDLRQFNLMFNTQLGTIAGEEGKLYLRPETAQGIFVNFLNVQKSTRQKIPFGIAQIGKAFRNEIVARQFIFRMREFEQMEMQFFIRPGEQKKWYAYWKELRMKWHRALHPENKLRYHDHEKLAHYADAALDIEFEFPFGFRELEGIHSRTDFDLRNHQELAGRKIQYFDPELNESYIPYVLETSIGLDRMFLATMSHALQEETVPDASGKDSTRTVLKLHPALAPVKCAVLPLVKNKVELTAKAREIFDRLKFSFNCQYDEKDAIGRRYRRQDAIGTPFCVTIDFDSLEDGKVTIRERDSLRQERIAIEDIEKTVLQRVDFKNLLD